jgi:hypothetical protein
MKSIEAQYHRIPQGNVDAPQGTSHLAVHLHDKLCAHAHQHRAPLLRERFDRHDLGRDGILHAGELLDGVVPAWPESKFLIYHEHIFVHFYILIALYPIARFFKNTQEIRNKNLNTIKISKFKTILMIILLFQVSSSGKVG